MAITTQLRSTMDALKIIPRMDALEAVCDTIIKREGYDAQLAPIWAEKLRHTYTKLFEIKYPEYKAANGDVLPVDTVDPAMLEWEYFIVDQHGSADWIDDDGQVAPSGSISVKRKTGTMSEMGHKWTLTVMDLERAAKATIGTASFPLAQLKQKNAKRTHDAKTNWTWFFGDKEKDLPGLCNHPNISITTAPLKASPGTVRAWDANATNDEIAADAASAINKIAQDTLEQYHAATVYMPPAYWRLLRDRRLGAGDGFASLLGLLQDRYKGDESGQGKITFATLLECASVSRLNPKTGTDTSGITGDFLLVLPAASQDELAFVRARPYTQRPPQERDMVLHHMTHSKIGGCKCQIPLAVHRFDFAVGS